MNKLGHWIAAAAVIACISPSTGCRICADCEDLAYPAYGGAWQRTRRDSGRVGSVFDSAGGQSSDLVDRDTPPTPDQLERERQQELGTDFGAPDRRPGYQPEDDPLRTAPESLDSPSDAPADENESTDSDSLDVYRTPNGATRVTSLP